MIKDTAEHLLPHKRKMLSRSTHSTSSLSVLSFSASIFLLSSRICCFTFFLLHCIYMRQTGKAVSRDKG